MQQNTLQQSDLIFPLASTSISKISTRLAKSRLSILNRLHSIVHDANLVQQVARDLCLENVVIANERCGGWYVPPTLKAGSSYFKSTDGHYGEWRFSLRRLNLHLLDMLGRNRAAMIVDSTSKGKSMWVHSWPVPNP